MFNIYRSVIVFDVFTVADDDIESYDSSSDIDDEEVEVRVYLLLSIFFFFLFKIVFAYKG